MSATTQFEIVGAILWLFPIVLALGIYFAPRPKLAVLRGLLAIFASWIALIAYTIYVYNPAGIAAGHEQGTHFPEGRFDNNTVAVMVLAGWVFPLVSVLFAALVGFASAKLRGKLAPAVAERRL
jgi:Na+/proline symporter